MLNFPAEAAGRPNDTHNMYVVCVAIPPFDGSTGVLPVGEHEAGWDEIQLRFGWNPRRRQLLDGLAEGLTILAGAGCTKVWLNGSFVTAKDEPGDFDAVWSPTGVDRNVLAGAGPELLDLRDHRDAQKARFGGEFLPNVTEAGSGKEFADFFQSDRDGTPKGIVAIDPTKEIWT
ncbi:DUF6932 family protein [Iamia sp.]|uniref:DUF6932 family protein n=1 Tax=Iamia sp. TaxID=2722710 RepID=UPI002C074775|nr:hypothetical protein [Iamia sp.]HXH59113.1 hypothetical protein [Iamia sp.]